MALQGTTMTIDPAVMQSAANTVDAQRAKIENCFNSISQDANSLKPLWEGMSATSYQTTMAKIAEDAPKIVSILREYVLDLNEIASSFMTEEQKRKAQSEALPSDVFGV